MKIHGHTLSTPVSQSNWNETNERRSSFIENKPPLKNGADGIPYFETPVVIEAPTADNHAATKGYVDSAVENIKKSGLRSVMHSDSSAAVTKEVPANAMPTAQVRIVGGMTYDCGRVVGNNRLDINTFKNLTVEGGTISVDGGRITANPDGTYIHGGVGRVALCTVRQAFPFLEVGNTYTFSYDSNLGGDIKTVFYCTDESGANYTFPPNSNPTSTSHKFTVHESYLDYVLIMGGGYAENIMFNEGDTALPYEPYFDPYTVYEDTKVTAVESVGKNLFSFFTGVYGRCGVRDISENSATVVCSDASNYSARCFTIPEWLGGKTVTVTGSWTASGNNIPGIRLMWMKGTSASTASTLYLTKSGESATCVVPKKPADADALRVYLYGNTTGEAQAGDTVTYTNVQVEIGSTATEWEPYREPVTLPIPAEVQALEGYGMGVSADMHNGVEWDADGKASYVERVKRKMLKGSETWYNHARDDMPRGTYCYYHIIEDAVGTYGKYNDLMLCSYGQRSKTYPLGKDGEYQTRSNVVYIFTNIPTQAEFKAWLAEQHAAGTPVTVVYPLATPVVTDISDLMTEDNLLNVYGGGTVAMANSTARAVPSTIDYQLITFA